MQRRMWKKIILSMKWEMWIGMTWLGCVQEKVIKPYRFQVCSLENVISITFVVALPSTLKISCIYQQQAPSSEREHSLWPCLHDAKNLDKNWNHFTNSLMIFRHSALWHCKGIQMWFFSFHSDIFLLCSNSQWLDKYMFICKIIENLYIIIYTVMQEKEIWRYINS